MKGWQVKVIVIQESDESLEGLYVVVIIKLIIWIGKCSFFKWCNIVDYIVNKIIFFYDYFCLFNRIY